MKIAFLQKKVKERYFLLLDIGSKWIKSLIFKKEEKKYKILAQVSKPLKELRVFDGIDFEQVLILKEIQGAVEEVKREFLERSARKIKEKELQFPLILGMPSDILREKLMTVEVFLHRPQKKIIEKEEEKIFQEALKAAKKETSRLFKEKSGISAEDIQFIDLKILETRIDGYSVPRLSGFCGERVDFKVLVAFLPEFYLESFRKNILKPLNLQLQKVSYLSSSLLKVVKNRISDAIFIEFQDNFTQIFLIKNENLERITGFEMGEELFLESFLQSLGLREERAIYLTQRYTKGLISEETRQFVRDILSQPLQNWFFNLKLKFKEMEILLPQDIFLFGKETFLPLIKGLLEENNWEEPYFFESPEIKIICPNDLRNIEDKTFNLKSPADIRSLLLCYFTGGSPKN